MAEYIELTMDELVKKINEVFDEKIKELKARPEPEAQIKANKAEMWKDTITKALTLGGVGIPADLYEDVLVALGKYGLFRQKAMNIPTKRDVKVPVGAEAIAYEVTEFNAIQELNLSLSLADFSLKKIAALVVLTNEMIESWDITDWITKTIAVALAKKEDAIGYSNVAGSSLSNIVTVTDLTALTYDTIATAAGYISEVFDGDAMWIVSRSAYRKLLALKDSQNRPLFEFNAGIKTILGYPFVRVADEMLPSDHYILFGSFSAVGFAYVPGMRLDSFNTGNVGAINLLQQDAIALRATERFNAKPLFADGWVVVKKQ
jgi:HK97 family phage major capsid protein